MVTRAFILALVLMATSAAAMETRVPRLHHAPVSVAPAGEPLVIKANIENPQLVKRALFIYRPAGQKKFRQMVFRRATPGPYAVVVAAERVRTPALEYTIELERSDGARIAVFATRKEPHRIQVPTNGMDRIEEALSDRLDDRRSNFFANGEYVSFGKSVADVDVAGVIEQREVDDQYWRVEGGYTYRPLRVVSEFSFRVGVVRGSAPVPVRDPAPGQSEDERFDVGLNYGASSVRFRFHDFVHFEPSILASVTEVGFSAGNGAAFLMGDPHGSKLTLGFEWIYAFGTRFYTQMDLQAHERVRISPIVEVTDMPSADDFGVRLLGELRVDIGWGFAVAGRGGYQARVATSGGPSAGGMLSYAF